jgi:hypothetical protein
MTLFEYLAIAFSLVYSLAALRLLGGLPAALAPGRRSFVHVTVTLFMLGLVAISFWTFWSLRDVDWTYVGFMVALLVPGTLYYSAAVLIPENPEAVGSWGEYYFAVHRRLYLGFLSWALAAAASATVNLGMGPLHPARGVHALVVVIGVLGAARSNERLHRLLAILLALLLIGASFAQLSPDWLTR